MIRRLRAIDASSAGIDRVVVDMRKFKGQIVVLQVNCRSAVRVHEQIVVDVDASGCLKQRLMRIIEEKIAVYLVRVVHSGAGNREAADE